MRDIKFRAWHKKYKKMFKIGQITLEKGIWNFEPDDREYKGMSILYQPSFVLMQYTGLHDKNGKEIYEGDIIQYEDIIKGLVRYSEKYAQYVLVNTGSVKDEFEPLGDYNMEVFEVIGNEFDNPDLLEKGAEE